MSVAYTPIVSRLDEAFSDLLGALAPWYEREEPDELGEVGADHLATTVWPLAAAAEKAAAAVGNTVRTTDGPATLRLWDVAIVANHLLGAATKGQDLRAFQALYVVVDKAHGEASEEWHPSAVEGEVSTTVDTDELKEGGVETVSTSGDVSRFDAPKYDNEPAAQDAIYDLLRAIRPIWMLLLAVRYTGGWLDNDPLERGGGQWFDSIDEIKEATQRATQALIDIHTWPEQIADLFDHTHRVLTPAAAMLTLMAGSDYRDRDTLVQLFRQVDILYRDALDRYDVLFPNLNEAEEVAHV